MLNKANRLLTNFEFNISRKYGKRFSGNFFHLFILEPRNYTGPTKVGFVVSTKFSKSAVVRNRVKRVFRESVRKSFDTIKPGYWLVVHPKTTAIGKKYEEISTDYNRLLQKIYFTR